MSNKTWTLFAAVLGSGIVFLDSSVLPVALPAIGREPRLFVDVLEGQSYVHYGYLLSLSALLVLAGALNDYFGRRRMFVLGLLGFGATSLLCGLAPNVELLIFFRVLQGAAGALLVPGSLAILTNTFEGEEQGRAFGIWAAASSAVTVLGPFVGGVLVEEVAWRAIFLINLPLIAVALWATRHVAESRDEQAQGEFDWLGALLVALAVGGLSFGAIFGEQRQWADPLAFVALGVGGLATLALPFYFARAHRPLIPLGLFRSRNFTVTNISTLLIYGALYVVFLVLPIFLVGTVGYNPPAAGLATVPSSLFLIFLSARFGALASRLGPRWFMTAGPLLMAAGVAWLARLPPDSAPWTVRLGEPATWVPPTSYLVDVLPGMALFGIGLAVMVAPLTTALMRSVPGRQAGLASAINNAISRVGPQLAGALVFIVVTATFYAALQGLQPGLDMSSPEVRRDIAPLNRPAEGVPPEYVEAARQASTQAFGLAMLTSAALLVLGALVNALGISDRQAAEGAADRQAATGPDPLTDQPLADGEPSPPARASPSS
ncbi:MAG TPA: MFS transporter [Candidatus Limnocylindria bacterium]|nr:MFS transporter [Candidatus Limnocylindria bacterium]